MQSASISISASTPSRIAFSSWIAALTSPLVTTTCPTLGIFSAGVLSVRMYPLELSFTISLTKVARMPAPPRLSSIIFPLGNSTIGTPTGWFVIPPFLNDGGKSCIMTRVSCPKCSWRDYGRTKGADSFLEYASW